MELFKLLGRISIENGEANAAIDDTTGKAESSESRFTSAFKKIGAAVTTYFAIDQIKQFGKAVVDAAAEVSAESSAFEQIMGDYATQASGKVNAIADATGMVSTRLTPYMTSMTAKFKGLGYDIEDATTLASEGLNLAADASAFWDKSLDDSMSALNSFINGSYEGGEAIGLFANDTQLAQYAIKQGLVSTTAEWSALDEATKQATRLQYAEDMYALSGATGQAAKESEQYANTSANAAEKWRQFKAELGEPVLQNIVLPILQKLSDKVIPALSQGFQEIKQWISENKDTIKGWGEVLKIAALSAGALALVWNGMQFFAWIGQVGSLTAALKLLNAATLGAVAAKIKDKAETVALIAMYAKDGIVKTASAVKTGLLTAATWLQTAAQTALNFVMNMNPISLIIIGIAALVAAFVVLWNKCEGFRNFFKKMWEGIKNVVSVVVEWIKENWKTMLLFLVNPLAGIFKYCYEHFEGFRNFVDGVIEAVKGFFVGLWNKIVEIFTSIIKWFRTHIIEPIAAFYEKWIAPVVNKIIEIVMKLVEIVIALFVGLWNLLYQNVITPIVEGFKWLWDKVKEFFTNLWNDVVAIWTAVSTWFNENVIQPVVNFFKWLWDKVKGFFQSLWDDIKKIWSVVSGWFNEKIIQPVSEFFSKMWSKIKNLASGAWDGIKSVFSSVGGWFRERFTEAYTAVTSIFSKIGDFFGKVWDKIKSTFSKLGTKIGDAIGGAVKSGINGVISMIEKTINKAIGLINGAIGLINKLPGVNVKTISKLSMPRLAQGGVLEKGQVGLLEGDGAEAVVPLENNKKWLSKVASDLNDMQSENGTMQPSDRVYTLLETIIELLEQLTGMKIYLDKDTLVGELAPEMDTRLGNINKLRLRGN